MILKLLKIPLFAIIFVVSNTILANEDFNVYVNGPDVVCPNEQNIGYSASATDAGTINSYTWIGAKADSDDPAKADTAKANAGSSESFDVKCTISAANDTGSKTKTTHICNVTSVITDNDKTAIMKDGSENITITAKLNYSLPAGGQIEWQESTDGGANWSSLSDTGTQITLSCSESVGKYKYRARVSGHTDINYGWQTSKELAIIEIKIIRVTSLQNIPQSNFNNSDNVHSHKKDLYLCASEDNLVNFKVEMELQDFDFKNSLFLGLLLEEDNEIVHNFPITETEIICQFQALSDKIHKYKLVVGLDNNNNKLMYNDN